MKTTDEVDPSVETRSPLRNRACNQERATPPPDPQGGTPSSRGASASAHAPGLTRRTLLRSAASCAAALAWGRTARAIGPLSSLHVVRLTLPGLPLVRKSAPFVLAQEVRLQTSIDVSLEVPELTLLDDELFYNPLAILPADRAPAWPSRKARDRLKAWLEAGGTLFVDNVGVAGPSAELDTRLRALLGDIFPHVRMVRVPPGHVLYRAFFRIDYPAGRIIARPYLEALPLEGRLAVIYSQNDITGAWCRDRFGRWEHDVVPGGHAQRQVALRLGINLVEYTLCQDYKDDQVHLDYLLRKRKWKITPAKIQ